MKLNEAIINIRVELQNSKLKKSGKNKFAGFEYYELSDFLPKLNELMQKHNVNDCFTIKNNTATLHLFGGENECNTYEIPFVMFDVPKNKNGMDSMQHIQYLGALNTYYKRYLYLNAFGITDGEVIDAMDNSQTVQPKPVAKITTEQVIQLKSLLTDADALAKFLAKANINRLEDLPASWYSKAVASLQG